jgi:hypothetical protein
VWIIYIIVQYTFCFKMLLKTSLPRQFARRFGCLG